MLTLQWLLERDQLALRLVAGDDPSGVAIAWVHSIELMDPTPWLQGGELVLTTGLRLPRARAEQAAYVRRLTDANVAALAFGTGVRFDVIPPALRDACAELGLPLVEVPLPTPFVAVTQAIAGRIAELQYESMQRTVGFQRRLTAAALRDGPGGVVRGLADELDAGVLLLDERRRVAESARVRSDLVERVRSELGRTGTGRTSMHVVESDRSIEWQSLGGGTGTSGWLAIDTTTSLSSTERVLVNQALSLLALLRDRPRGVLDQRRRVGSTVLDLLLGQAEEATAVHDHLREFGFEAGDQVAVLVARPDAGAPAPDDLTRQLDALGLPYVATTRTDSGAIVLVRSADADLLAEQVTAARQGPARLTIGVSGPVDQDRVATGLIQAEQAAESARWSQDRIARYESLTLAAVLADDAVRARVGGLTDTALAPLRERPVLLESLETFLRTNGSWETASRMLSVHRHTLRNRMAKVEELTGMSLDVAEHRVLLLLALLSR